MNNDTAAMGIQIKTITTLPLAADGRRRDRTVLHGDADMIKLMPELPPHVVGLVASGQVTAEDYETVVIPAVEAALKTHDRIRLLYHIGPEWTGFTAGAMWDDAKVGLSHMAAWEKVAVVTDVEWIRAGMKFFGFTITGVVKIFGNEQLDEAKSWVSD